jgi:PAP2 superfamily
MRLFLKFTGVFLSLVLGSGSLLASDNDPVRSLSIDAAIWVSTYSMERVWYQPTGQRNFISDVPDRKFRDSVHTSEDTVNYNATEEKWRKASDVGVFGLIGTSALHSVFGTSPRPGQWLVVNRAFALNNLFGTTLKLAVHRSRPKASRYEAHSQKGDDAKSFPSGHSSNAFVAATSLALMAPESPLALRVGVYAVATSVGLARIMADKHNLTDVVVGAVMGVGMTHLVFANWYLDNVKVTATPTSVTMHYFL